MSRHNKKNSFLRRPTQFDGPTLRFSTESIAMAYYGHATTFHPPVSIAVPSKIEGRYIPIAATEDSIGHVIVGEIATAVEKQHLYGDGIAVVD
jgi:hypothetical protein